MRKQVDRILADNSHSSSLPVDIDNARHIQYIWKQCFANEDSRLATKDSFFFQESKIHIFKPLCT